MYTSYKYLAASLVAWRQTSHDRLSTELPRLYLIMLCLNLLFFHNMYMQILLLLLHGDRLLSLRIPVLFNHLIFLFLLIGIYAHQTTHCYALLHGDRPLLMTGLVSNNTPKYFNLSLNLTFDITTAF